jgi:hypothetical protein
MLLSLGVKMEIPVKTRRHKVWEAPLFRQSLTVAVLFLAGSGTTDTQQAPAAPMRAAGTNAVVADVVVRDAKGDPVTALTKADFRLFEDGVAQQIGDVTVVGVAAADATVTVNAGSPSTERSELSATAVDSWSRTRTISREALGKSTGIVTITTSSPISRRTRYSTANGVPSR